MCRRSNNKRMVARSTTGTAAAAGAVVAVATLVGLTLSGCVIPSEAKRPFLSSTTTTIARKNYPHFLAMQVLRGGSSEPSHVNVNYDPYDPSRQYASNQPAPPPTETTTATTQDSLPSEDFDFPVYEDDPWHETVQERVDMWKNKQREYGETMKESLRDEQGRTKLLTSVSRGSRALIFFFLMWRNVHLYEVADSTFRGLKRLILVTPMILLFVGNMAGVVTSLSSHGHSSKRRLKAILNLDKLVEAILIIYAFGRLTIAPSKYVPREIYITNIFHSALFILQCQAFTRLSWDENAAQPLSSFGHDQQQQEQQQQQHHSYTTNQMYDSQSEPIQEQQYYEDDDDDFRPGNPFQGPY